MTIPFADRSYSSNYNVKFDNAQLQKIARPHVSTHINKHAERFHQAIEAIMLPARWNVQLLSRIIQPIGGANKDSRWGVIIRLTCIALWILSIPVALTSALLSYSLRMIAHRYRPALSYIDASGDEDAKTKNLQNLDFSEHNPLHIRTHNIGFVTTGMSNIGDLRHPVERAHDIVQSVVNDPHKPDIICFQETFHEDALKVLCEGIKKEYPYIIYNVAPHGSGFTSGSMMASKYPPTCVEFQCLDHNIFPETLSPKGVLKVRFDTPKGPLFIYNAHTQALIGEDRANARFHQLEQIKNIMAADKSAHPHALQVLCGDLNTSRVNAWGGDNCNPPNQAEARVMARLNQEFDDHFPLDHDELTGQRTKGVPRFLPHDNHRMGVKLTEPAASWFDGPFYEPGVLLSKKMANDRRKHGRAEPLQVKARKAQASWGTKPWHQEQPAENARFDYILFPKNQQGLEAKIEIRRLAVAAGTQSAPSDHLPVDAIIKFA